MNIFTKLAKKFTLNKNPIKNNASKITVESDIKSINQSINKEIPLKYFEDINYILSLLKDYCNNYDEIHIYNYYAECFNDITESLNTLKDIYELKLSIDKYNDVRLYTNYIENNEYIYLFFHIKFFELLTPLSNFLLNKYNGVNTNEVNFKFNILQFEIIFNSLPLLFDTTNIYNKITVPSSSIMYSTIKKVAETINHIYTKYLLIYTDKHDYNINDYNTINQEINKLITHFNTKPLYLIYENYDNDNKITEIYVKLNYYNKSIKKNLVHNIKTLINNKNYIGAIIIIQFNNLLTEFLMILSNSMNRNAYYILSNDQIDTIFTRDLKVFNDVSTSTTGVIISTSPQKQTFKSGGKSKSNYKKTENKITVLFNKKKYTRVIYICERKKYVKINKTFMLLSKLKKV
jgi:hypothetical protein